MSEEVFGVQANYYKDPSGNVFCYRNDDETVRMSSVSKLFDDPRFMCSNGDMSWYRGRRNIAFNNLPCLFWNSVLNSTFDISDASSSSYSMRRILPDEYENFCRNPDKNPRGPWCYVDLVNVGIVKTSCFEPCRNMASDSFVCLNKQGFPYESDNYDMSDILDLPQLISTFQHVHLMSESRYILPLKLERRQRKTCINSGTMARSFGPWIAVLDDEARKFIRNVGRRKLIELCAPEPKKQEEVVIESSETSALRDGLEEDELTVSGCSFWRRCFSACQDDVKTCWGPNDKEYFGSRKLSALLQECVSWTEATSVILTAVKNTLNSEEAFSSNLTSMFHLYYHLLFEDEDNSFVNSRTFMNTENVCMLLGKKTEKQKDDMETKYLGTKLSKFIKLDKYREVYKNLYENGPGCFVRKEKILSFEPCYNFCSMNYSDTRHFTKPLCLYDKEYSLCAPPKAEKHLTRGRYEKNRSNYQDALISSAVVLISFFIQLIHFQ